MPLPSLDELINQYTTIAQGPMPSEDVSWQQELLKTVDPEHARKQAIRQALAKASMTLATTPGNFLTGLSAAAATGANEWANAQPEMDQRRMQVLNTLRQMNQQNVDQRLGRISDMIQMRRGINSDARQADEQSYDRQMKEREFGLRESQAMGNEAYRQGRLEIARQKAEQDARKIDAAIGAPGASGPKTFQQRRLALDSITKAVQAYRETLGDPRWMGEEERAAASHQVQEYEATLFTRYGIDPATGAFVDPGMSGGMQSSKPPTTSKFGPDRPSQDDAINEARAAIARGADRAKVIERLKSMGYDASGL